MIKEFNEFSTGALLKIGDSQLLQSYTKERQLELYTFIWVRDHEITVSIDSIETTIAKDTIVVLTPNQFFRSIDIADAMVYQFNREFYCIKDHDKEVSCMGILFFGNSTIPVVQLKDKDLTTVESLHSVFLDEMETVDTIQAEMLRMLVKRLIITTTRLIKKQSDYKELASDHVDLVRSFNALVEDHFRSQHSVSFYAEKLYKSPKTLSNTFSKLKSSPLQIIHNRIILEAKRLLIYTDKTAKEIAYEIGFEDASHLSRMFKKHTTFSPSEFRKLLKTESLAHA